MQMRPLMRLGLLALLVPSLLVGCGGSTSKAETADTTGAKEETRRAPSPFEVDSAYSFLTHQVSLGARVPGTPAHSACASWIESKLREWGYKVTLQPFKGKDYHGKDISGTNIIATRHPEESGERILLMAHWDTRPVADQDPNPYAQSTPILGADDGASGVAVLLEIARQESLLGSERAIDFVFFDLEDGGQGGSDDSWCLGSTYWAKHPHTPGYKARYGILLDMVGAQGARFYWETLSREYARPILSALWSTAAQLGWGGYFVQANGGAMTDDHVPVIRHLGIPCVDIINFDPTRATGFGSHWHTTHDDMNIISIETLRAVGETVSTTIREEF